MYITYSTEQFFMEQYKNILHLAHHRSKERIRDFGEVFTPDEYVQKMLDMSDHLMLCVQG